MTDSLGIAVKFASYPNRKLRDDEPHEGQLYVLNVAALKQSGKEVFSLKKSIADRPRQQQAYSIPLAGGEDLQSTSDFPETQVKRYRFKTTNGEKLKYFDPELMIARGDRVAKEAGYCCHQIIHSQ